VLSSSEDVGDAVDDDVVDVVALLEEGSSNEEGSYEEEAFPDNAVLEVKAGLPVDVHLDTLWTPPARCTNKLDMMLLEGERPPPRIDVNVLVVVSCNDNKLEPTIICLLFLLIVPCLWGLLLIRVPNRLRVILLPSVWLALAINVKEEKADEQAIK
jgi:hypothetical protein